MKISWRSSSKGIVFFVVWIHDLFNKSTGHGHLWFLSWLKLFHSCNRTTECRFCHNISNLVVIVFKFAFDLRLNEFSVAVTVTTFVIRKTLKLIILEFKRIVVMFIFGHSFIWVIWFESIKIIAASFWSWLINKRNNIRIV